MNYYIQGEAAKAEQIKAAFNGKGIYSNCNFANENYLYYQCDGKVAFCFIGGGLANIIKTHPDYKELELPKPHYDIANFKPFDHCRFKPTEAHDWIYADFWYVQAHYIVEQLFAIEKWES